MRREIRKHVIARGVATLAIGATVAIGAIGAIESTAYAADQSEELIRRGVELRRTGQDEQALEAFRSAYQIRATPRAQGQMGFAEQALGRWIEAEKDLTSAIRSGQDPWVAKNMATLRQALDTVAQHLGNLQVLGSPTGAHVKVDERDIGTIPFGAPVRVSSGEIVVSVSAPGHIGINRKLTVPAGMLLREVINLHAVDQPEAQAAAKDDLRRPVQAEPNMGGGGGGDVPAVPPAKEAPAAEAVRRDMESNGARARGLGATQWWGVGVGTAGVVSAAVGTVFLVQAISKNNDSKPHCPGDVCDNLGSQARQDAITAGNRATVAFVVGGVLVAGGAALLLFGRSSETSSSSTALQLTPTFGPREVALSGAMRF